MNKEEKFETLRTAYRKIQSSTDETVDENGKKFEKLCVRFFLRDRKGEK